MTNNFYKHQRGLKVVAHFILFILAYFLAFGFRFNFEIPVDYWALLWATIPVIIAIKMIVFWRFGMFRASWRYVGSKDVVDLGKVSALSVLLAAVVIYTLWLREGFPRSILIMDFLLTMVLVGGARFSSRVVREMRTGRLKKEGQRVVIIGAGDAGESLVGEIHKYAHMKYHVASYFDDNPSKIGINIHGVSVRGPIDRIGEFVTDNNIEIIFIAVPSAKPDRMRRIIELCRQTPCEVKIIPGLDQLMDGRVTVSQLRDVDIEDLLGREPVQLDNEAISLYLCGKTVLVTGAAGSIGSEICRQVLRFDPKKLLLFDQAETGMFEIHNELTASTTAAEIIPYMGDVCDRGRVSFVLSSNNPEVIFHAAAYKHVPVMEENPTEAVKNNVLGTKIVADLARIYDARRFVFISTDKAVNPTSVMGATKRVTELYLQALNSVDGTKYVTVRFGNVLDSAGSVIPIFRRQIATGGPVTVTHPEMTRYFMTIPEATQLVLQAAAMGRGGEIFTLDMGESVKILDLARDMIRLSGFTPDEEIDIVFTGIRPGEKLFEELWRQDDLEPTKHHKIFIKDSDGELPDNFEKVLESLLDIASNGQHQHIKGKLVEMVPEYRRLSTVQREA